MSGFSRPSLTYPLHFHFHFPSTPKYCTLFSSKFFILTPIEIMAERSEQDQNAEDLYLESYAFTTAAAIVGSVDRKIFVVLRDGRNVFGILRTFDQFANVVLQDTIERIYLNEPEKRFAEEYRGVFMIRGENVVMMGELDIDTEDDHLQEYRQIPFPEANKEYKSKQLATIKEQKAKSKSLLDRGLISDFAKTDMY